MSYEFGHNIAAALIVAFFAWIGGLMIQLTKGLNPPEVLPNWKTRPLMKTIVLPSLFGQLIFGCIARNALYIYMDEHYSDNLSDWIQMIANLVIFVRSGLELEFKSQGLMVLLLTIGPLIVEGIVVAITTRLIFTEVPWAMAFGLGFIVSDNTAAIMVPLLIRLHEGGYGVAKGLPVTLLAAQSFDDVIAIPLFGVCQALTMNAAAGENTNIALMLIEIFYKILLGFASSFIVGTQLWFFRNCGMTVKFLALIVLGIGQLVFYTLIDFDDSKYLAVIFMGYFALRVWGEDKPDEELNVFWNISKPFLFGTVGAQILIREMEFGIIGYALVVIVIGTIFRLITTYFCLYEKKYNNKERIFTAVAWSPKATVQAAFGGIILSQAKARDLPELIRPGIIFLTICILSIIITAPPGAVLTVALGEKWLEKTEKRLSSRLSKYGSRASQKKTPYLSNKGSRVHSRVISKLHTLKEENEDEDKNAHKKEIAIIEATPFSKTRTMASHEKDSYYDNMSIFTEENLVRNMVYDIFGQKKCLEEDKNSNETDAENEIRNGVEEEEPPTIYKHPLYYDD